MVNLIQSGITDITNSVNQGVSIADEEQESMYTTTAAFNNINQKVIGIIMKLLV